MAYVLRDGAVWNPAHRVIGRNDACPCGSAQKFKRCCKDRLPRAVLASDLIAPLERLLQSQDGNSQAATNDESAEHGSPR